MSVVVAIKKGEVVYLGADSQVTRGGTRETLSNPNNYKIWKVKNVDGCFMGHVGLLREANIVKLMNNLVSDYDVYNNYVDYEYIVKSVVPSIFDELKKYGYLKDEQFVKEIESRFMFIFKDKIFTIGFDGAVIEVDDYAAIGSGEDQAIGSLLSTEGEEPVTRIVKAIKASAASDIYVDYPIIITNSKDGVFDVVKETNESKYLKSKASLKAKEEH